MDGTEQEPELVESLSYGRAGIVRAGGRVVFVEGVAPGDRIRFEILRDHGRWAEGRLVEIVEPSPHRTSPPCPLASTCGGCPWQHVDYGMQLRAKRQAVVDALERLGGFRDPPVAPITGSPRVLGYRNRLKLRVESGRIGFYRAATHALVEIDDCPVAEDAVRASLPAARRLLATLSTRVTRVEIASRGLLPGVVFGLNSAGRLRPSDRERVKEFLAQRSEHGVAGVVMWGRGWKRSWGDTRRRTTGAGGVTIETAGSAFGQVNTEANRTLVELAVEALEPRPGDTLLELYAGAGNFTLPLAPRVGSITAVESDRDAVESGRASAAHHGLTTVDFVHERVERFVAGGIGRFSAILANPPRNGLGASAAAIARGRAGRVVYVSCNPATLARDLRVFADKGYRLDRVIPVDMFPHTFHVESVCRLTC